MIPRSATRPFWLIFALALSGCALTGKAVLPPPSCPEPPPMPRALMRPPDYERQARRILFAPPPNAMPRSAASKPPSGPMPEPDHDREH